MAGFERSDHLWAALATVKAVAFWAFVLAFAVKVPIWPFHTGCQTPHTEAPTGGSMILAGVLLKLGAYGFLRFVLPLFPAESSRFAFGWHFWLWLPLSSARFPRLVKQTLNALWPIPPLTTWDLWSWPSRRQPG